MNMAVEMEGKVPGGRKRSTGDEFITDGEEGDYGNKTASQSLPRFATPTPTGRVDTLPGDNFNRTQTLDRKKKASSFRSFGTFMQKMSKQFSGISVQNPGGKGKKSRGRSTGKENPSSGSAPTSRSGSCDLLDTSSGNHSNSIIKYEKGKTPGVVGIRNHGNTCFMNAVLQCLSNTELLTEYFITDQYKTDIKRNNKHNARKYGTRGELTEHLVALLKGLWTCQYTADISNDFKSVIGKYGSQYRGYSQHDAQEFLLWLLDKVHEDLNIATKKKYRPNKSSVGRTDEAVAQEALANHTRCNNSYVYDLFQALYRSSLTCPNCRRQSNTFDPFLSVSLPIPQKTKRPVYVTVVYLDSNPKQVQIGLLMAQSDTVRELRQTLSSDTKIPENQLILTEIYYDGFHRTFHDSLPLAEIQETDNVYAIETPSPVIESSSSSQSENPSFITTVVLNKTGSGTQGRRFGGPLVLLVARHTSFLDLQNDILHNMTSMLREGIIAQKMGVLFRLRVIDGIAGKSYLPHDVGSPLLSSTVDRSLSNCLPGAGPEHLKLVVEWDQQTKQCLISNVDDTIEEHASVRQVKLAHQQPVLGTLDECFQLYTQEERLGADDAWHCPNCRKRQTGTIKTLSLWSLPDILVIHMKRFKQDGVRRTKLNTLITFPVCGLDMTHHVAKRQQGNHSNKTSSMWSPWKPASRQTSSQPGDNVYDLYAVCNHYGNMQGGHYTAFCLNPADNQWYSYDDTKVTPIQSDGEVITRAAYILFYQRRSSRQHNLSDPNHWVHRLSRLRYTIPPPPTSKSHEDLLEDNHSGDYDNVPTMGTASVTSNTTPMTSDTEQTFPRSVHAYATLRTPQKPSHHVTQSPPPSVPQTPSMSSTPVVNGNSHIIINGSPHASGFHGNQMMTKHEMLSKHMPKQRSLDTEVERCTTLPAGYLQTSSTPPTPSLSPSPRGTHRSRPPVKRQISLDRPPPGQPQHRALSSGQSTKRGAWLNTSIQSGARVGAALNTSIQSRRSATRELTPQRSASLDKGGTPGVGAGKKAGSLPRDSTLPRAGIPRSSTVPEVAAPITSSNKPNKEGAVDLKKWNYNNRTVFMQESCV